MKPVDRPTWLRPVARTDLARLVKQARELKRETREVIALARDQSGHLARLQWAFSSDPADTAESPRSPAIAKAASDER